jgi:uncharacterized RDD family membrane protein YckC
MADDTTARSFFSKPPAPPSPRPPILAPVATQPRVNAAPPPPPTAARVEVDDAGIFSRFAARFIDSSLITAVVEVVMPTLPVSPRRQNLIAGCVALFIWVFIEAAMLTRWGATPGKWFLGITVRTIPGARPELGVALHRSFGVWWRGMSAGLPLANLITAIRTWIQIKRYREATWDAEAGLVVHQRVQTWRLILLGLLVISVIALYAFVGEES